ncbi:hypothetical protein PT2222_140158 [Paraburkholderia tropica]
MTLSKVQFAKKSSRNLITFHVRDKMYNLLKGIRMKCLSLLKSEMKYGKLKRIFKKITL